MCSFNCITKTLCVIINGSSYCSPSVFNKGSNMIPKNGKKFDKGHLKLKFVYKKGIISLKKSNCVYTYKQSAYIKK